MTVPYDPVPDIAAALTGVYFAPAHGMPADVAEAFSRLARKLGFDTTDLGHMASACEVEAALRRHLTPGEPAA